MIVVMYEDRPQALVGVRLAILSLARHCPRLPVLVWAPNADGSFNEWSRNMANVEVRNHRSGVFGRRWDVKPSVLLNALSERQDTIMWLDSDVILTGDVEARLSSVDPEAVVGTEEYFWGDHQGTTYRTTGLGLTPARRFTATINTGLLRVAPSHVPLLSHWCQILACPEYEAAQEQMDRPIHFFGDQEVLTGLLGSSSYAHVPVVQLRRGADIAQCFGPSGFTARERIRSGRSLPMLIHAMGRKPWAEARSFAQNGPPGVLRRAVEAIHQDLTPYVEVARTYREELGVDAAWLEPRTRAGATMIRLLPGHPALRELPLTAVESLLKRARRALRIDLDKVSPPTAG